MKTYQITKEQYNLLTPCLSKDTYREQFNYVYIDNTNLVATDGCRMMILEKDGFLEKNKGSQIEPGFYIPTKTNKQFYLTSVECSTTFPPYKKIIPIYTEEHLKGNFTLSAKPKEYNTILCQIILKTGCIINLDYFKPLKLTPFKIYSDKINTPILAKFPGGLYIIMPISQEQN